MKVFIAGIDGYIGWALAGYLGGKGHEVGGCDNFLRRRAVEEIGSESAVPIFSMEERKRAFEEQFGRELYFRKGDMTGYGFVEMCLKEFQPDAIVNLGQMPSAPYSLIDVDHATFTQHNNVIGNLNLLFAMKEACPEAQLVKLGSMGEYGTPNVDIPEGMFDMEFRGRTERMFFPRRPGSFYHLSKVHDSHNVWFACKTWGLKATDVMQGVVYGVKAGDDALPKEFATRFDFDHVFGTVINRFCAQAVAGKPLTPYGEGRQRRGFLPLRDSVRCIEIALENEPEPGEYRTFNQFDETYGILELAELVADCAGKLGVSAEIQSIENPRFEMEEHYYNPDHENLLRLGYEPTGNIRGEITLALKELMKYEDRVKRHDEALMPDIWWNGDRRVAEAI